nr:NADH dehydrogenase subunit 4L [Pilophorus typicus]
MFYYFFDYFCMLYMFMGGLIVFCSIRKHLLVTLLSLEYLVLCVFMFLMYFVIFCLGNIYMIMIFLTFSVCEGVLGLSVLVGLIRCHGNDQVKSLFFVSW